MFDVLLSTADGPVLSSYRVILLVGDVTFDVAVVDSLRHALRAGSRLLLAPRHAIALGDDLARLQEAGAVEILDPWINPATRRPAAISKTRLVRLTAECLPIAVTGDPIQYQINRNARGWVIELVHNGGVTKKPTEPAVVNSEAAANVVLLTRVPITAAHQWTSGADQPLSVVGGEMRVTVPPGSTVFVEFTTH